MPTTTPDLLKTTLEGLTAPSVHVAMPSSPSSPMVVRQLQDLNPDYPQPEQQRLDPNSHCINPKCDYQLDPETAQEVADHGTFVCPRCGIENKVEPEKFESGGHTHAGLSLEQMGSLGESLIERIGELPGVGAVKEMSAEYNFPIDCIVQSGHTKYGCEIKTNHSEAQPRFRLGDQKERLGKIQYCLENGLKPALIGVRLNFFNDKANIFFREGMSDTWFGNKNMRHVCTVDFSDLNPFQGSPVIKQHAIESADLPDQSNPDADIDAMFGPILSAVPGTFTIDHDIHSVKIVDKKGNATHDARYCVHCGHIVYKPNDRPRIPCPTCGEDPERQTKAAKIYAAKPGNPTDINPNWEYGGTTLGGHRKYTWINPKDGVSHTITLSSGRTDQANKIDMQRAQRRMHLCETGQCDHVGSLRSPLPLEQEPGQPIFRAGETVTLNGTPQIIVDIEGNLALVQDMSGQEDMAYLNQLQKAGAKDPDFMFIYYNSALKIIPWHHNNHYDKMLEDLLKEYGFHHIPFDLDPGDIDAGEVFEYSDGSIKIERKQLSRQEIRQESEKAIGEWMADKQDVLPASAEEGADDEGAEEEADDEGNDHDEDAMDFAESNHWRRLPRDEDGQWSSL